jgi:phospholipid transport system substrate-binding protein
MTIKKSITITLLLITTLVANLVQANSSFFPGYGGMPMSQMHMPQMPMQQNRPYYGQRYPHAQRYPQPKPSPSPVDILEGSINKVLKLLAQPQTSDMTQLRSYIKEQVAANFDFDYMSKWVAGKRYYKMNKEQQVFFKQKFTKVFLSTFINKLTKDTKSLPTASQFQSQRQNQKEARASVLFRYDNGLQVKVEFRFFKTAKGWKVVDVKANGISALMYFRNYFSQLIKQRQSKS